MSEYAQITIENLSLMSFRNYLEGEIVSLFFSREDLVTIEEKNGEETYTRYAYKTTVKNAKNRMKALGYGLERFKKLYNEKVLEAVDCANYLFRRGIDFEDQEEYVKKKLLKHLSFKKWKNLLKKLVSYELKNGNLEFNKIDYQNYISTVYDRIIYCSICDDENNGSIYGLKTKIIEAAYVYGIVLDCCDDTAVIELDFTDLQHWDDDCIPKALEAVERNEKIIVLVEGTSDKDILEFALRQLYPYLSDLFYFMDFEDGKGGKRDGGTSFLIKNLKTFYFSHLNVKFIAIFDNDAEGFLSRCSLLNEIKEWPDNFRILCYPELKQMKKYPTIGPNGSVMMSNINKCACSIELYLPDRIIKKDSRYLPIEWESLKKGKGLDGEDRIMYQGVIAHKDYVKKEFHELRQRIENGKEVFLPEEWIKLDELLKTIIYAFYR